MTGSSSSASSSSSSEPGTCSRYNGGVINDDGSFYQIQCNSNSLGNSTTDTAAGVEDCISMCNEYNDGSDGACSSLTYTADTSTCTLHGTGASPIKARNIDAARLISNLAGSKQQVASPELSGLCPNYNGRAVNAGGADYQVSCSTKLTGSTVAEPQNAKNIRECLFYCNEYNEAYGGGCLAAAISNSATSKNCNLYGSVTGTSSSGTVDAAKLAL
ncbi:MAG: hypothetical protein Q9227_006834 [Pyrenula ochraceoflavens]